LFYLSLYSLEFILFSYISKWLHFILWIICFNFLFLECLTIWANFRILYDIQIFVMIWLPLQILYYYYPLPALFNFLLLNLSLDLSHRSSIQFYNKSICKISCFVYLINSHIELLSNHHWTFTFFKYFIDYIIFLVCPIDWYIIVFVYVKYSLKS